MSLLLIYKDTVRFTVLIKNIENLPRISKKYPTLKLHLRQNERYGAFSMVAVGTRVIHAGKLFGFSTVIVYSLVRRFEHAGC